MLRIEKIGLNRIKQMARNRKRKGLPVHGWLNLDKPSNMTSTQAVGALKRLFNAQKVGHSGTLDPLATGILPIAFGEATKTVQWVIDGEKEYIFTIGWGRSTTTLDLEGETDGLSEVRPTSLEINAVLASFIGEIEQIPPKFSAIKIEGKRAYDLARDSDEFELEARPVIVHEAELLKTDDINHSTFRMRVGKGFYVRSFARDIAIALNTVGHVTKLRRTQVGAFSEKDTVKLSEIESSEQINRTKFLVSIGVALNGVPSVEVIPDTIADIRQGRAAILLRHVIDAWRLQQPDDRIAVARDGDEVIALGEIRAGRFFPTRVFQY